MENIATFSHKLQIWFYLFVIFLILIISNKPIFAQVIINDPSKTNSNIFTNNLILNNWIFFTDSINQFKLNSNVRSDLFNIEREKIELYSLFDGNYNLRFIQPYLDTASIYHLYHQNKNTKNKFNQSTKINLFSGTNNGNLQFDFAGNYRSFYWLFQPYFDISDGVLYPDQNNTIFNQSLLRGSGYQNILNHLEFGIISSHSSLVFDLNFNISELYIPLSRFDTNTIHYKFNDYNQFLGIIKFSNTFSDDLKINGKVFLMDSFRDAKPSIDTNSVLLQSDNSYNLEEFYYGLNLMIVYNLFFKDNPTKFGLNYRQNLFLFDNKFVGGRQRIETESLNWSFEQKYDYSNNNSIIAAGEYKSKAVLLSTFGDLPNHLYNLNLNILHNHIIKNNLKLTNLLKYNNFEPFMSNYYALNEHSIENLSLSPETWIELQNTLENQIDTNLFYKLKFDIFYGKDIILQVIDNDIKLQYKNIANKFGVDIGLDFNYFNDNFGVRWQAALALQKINQVEVKIQNGLRTPKFQTKLSYSQNILNFMTFQADLEYLNGIPFFNKTKNMIEIAQIPILLSFILQKQFDNSYIFVILKNVSSQYYEINYGLPEKGLNITLGTKILI